MTHEKCHKTEKKVKKKNGEAAEARKNKYEKEESRMQKKRPIQTSAFAHASTLPSSRLR